ncbi:MAG: hypothetical protein IPO63_11970 [Bacteroidetes bacterium]|nr:hypothetical protein [Bacteroidota bacterium]
MITQALNNTTAQVNLLDIQSHPTETNTSITFYDQRSGAVLYNFMHTINAKGVPDTVQIDPLGMYRVTAHTFPSVSKDSVTLTAGKHTVIALDAPQGDLQLKIDSANEYKKLYAIVRKHGEKATLNVQEFSDITRYIVGDYDLEVLTLPRIHINNVNVAQSKTTSVQIPTPGLATIICNAPGYGDILVEKDNKLEWVDRISLNSVKESIVLQPDSIASFSVLRIHKLSFIPSKKHSESLPELASV